MLPTSPPPADAPVTFAARLVTAGVALGFALFWLRPLMIPFVLALFLSYGLAPLISWLHEKLHLPRAVGILVSLLLGTGLLVGIGLLIASSAQQMAERAPEYEAALRGLAGEAVELLRGWGLDIGEHPIQAELSALPVRSWLSTATIGLFDVLSTGFLGAVFLIYLLASAGTPQAPEGVSERIQRRIRKYLVAKTAIAAAVGAATATLLWALDVPLALTFGVLAFALDFIPNIGSLFAGLLPLTLMLLSPAVALWQIGVAAVGLVVIHMGSGNYVTPKVMGDSLQLHPITVLLALIFWGMLWGPVGALLAAPLTAALKIFFEESERLQPLARLMAGEHLDG